MSSARELLAPATRQLAAAGVASPRVDAELLLAHVLGIERPRLVLVGRVDDAASQQFGLLLARRIERVPLQHLVGRAPFRYLDLAVGPGVFVPRPETELLVDAVLAALATVPRPVVVDLCAGSGALGLAIAHEAPNAQVYAVENSPGALVWLRQNAATSRVSVLDADVRDPDLLAALRAEVDVVVSNPPYVPDSTAVQPEVRADPRQAVFAGADGLAVLPAVLARAAELLRAGGVLAVEHDDTHELAVTELLRAQGGWAGIGDHRDLSGRPRFATARRVGVAPTAG